MSKAKFITFEGVDGALYSVHQLGKHSLHIFCLFVP